MTSFGAKIVKTFKNLKSDAVPRPARPETTTSQEDQDVTHQDNTETPNIQENVKKEKKIPKFKPSFTPNKKKKGLDAGDGNGKPGKTSSNSNINTQATGNVINVINSNFRWGNDIVYNIGVPNAKSGNSPDQSNKEDLIIVKDNLITLVMESKIRPEHEYIDYISKNLGNKWRTFFRSMGFSSGRVETVEKDEERNGVSEARYKLLLEWARNDENGTLGRLATFLWNEGERQIVKELSLMYKRNCM